MLNVVYVVYSWKELLYSCSRLGLGSHHTREYCPHSESSQEEKNMLCVPDKAPCPTITLEEVAGRHSFPSARLHLLRQLPLTNSAVRSSPCTPISSQEGTGALGNKREISERQRTDWISVCLFSYEA
jgi:hypothetical protein